MTAPPAPQSGRRASLGAAAVLAGFLLLAPPLYVLGPFALLTILARPRTFREAAWLSLAVVAILTVTGGGGPLGAQLLMVSGLLVSLLFPLLSVRARRPAFPRALLAVGLSAAGVGLWCWSRDISWAGVESGFADMLRASYQAMVELAGPAGSGRQDMERFVQPFVAAAPDVARFLPGVLTLQALLGVSLAWAWHHRVSTVPLGTPPGNFAEFRFNDQLVWGAIFTLGMVLITLPQPVATFAVNLLIVWVGLYAVRGLAVVTAFLRSSPPFLKLLAAGFALLLVPLVLGATVALGLADTWLDIRGRLQPPAPEGV